MEVLDELVNALGELLELARQLFGTSAWLTEPLKWEMSGMSGMSGDETPPDHDKTN